MSKPRKPKPDVHALVARLNKASKALLERELVAPLLPGGKIRTRLGGMVYEFKLKGEFVGWGRFRPLNERSVEPLGEALPWERSAYLELFPVLRVLLLWPDTNAERSRSGIWWAWPFNESDARQRFGFTGEPLPVFLCDPTNGAERFERVLARVDGGTLWFDGPDLLADPTHAEWLRDATAQEEIPDTFLPGLASSERLALLYWQIRQLELAQGAEGQQQTNLSQQNRQEQREWLRRHINQSQLEGRLRYALEKADAVLHSYSELPNQDGTPGMLIVEWSEHGQTRRYRSTINPNLSVVSSGICLSDRDRDFDLTSLVNVMNDTPW